MKEQILKEFDEEYLEKIDKYNPLKENLIKLFTDQKQFLIKAIDQTREGTIREEIKRKEEMIITKDNAEELVHTPLCKENQEKGNNHFFCNITNEDYFRNQTIFEDIKYLKQELNKLKK